MYGTKPKELTPEHEQLWAAAEVKRQRCEALRHESDHILSYSHEWAKIQDQALDLSREADVEQADITTELQFFQEKTGIDTTLAVVKYYEDINASGKRVWECNALAASDVLDAKFMKRYTAKETDEHIALVRVLGNAAWSALMAFYNDSPRHEDKEVMTTSGWLGYTVRLKYTNTTERMLELAIHLCLKSPTCASALLDCATALGVTDEAYFNLLGIHAARRMDVRNLNVLIQAHPPLLGRSGALALGYANHCTVEYWLPAAHFNDFVELVKSNPAWFALPRLVRNLTGTGHLADTKQARYELQSLAWHDPFYVPRRGHLSDTSEALRAARVLACIDPVFLHRERVDLGHLIDALKGNKQHMKRLEALAAKIEDPKHRDMAAEHAAAMADV